MACQVTRRFIARVCLESAERGAALVENKAPYCSPLHQRALGEVGDILSS